MHILVVAATGLEIPLVRTGPRGRHHVDVLVTGIGMVATAAHCGRALARTSYDMAFNFGVCGAFGVSLAPGAVVHITSDRLSELGAEDDDRFVPIEEMGLPGGSVIVNSAPPDSPVLHALPAVSGITVNTIHGRESTIREVVARFAPHVESMEGAAFAYACALSGVPYAQVRGVSNVVERRNRAAWRLELAVTNVNDVAVRLLDSL